MNNKYLEELIHPLTSKLFLQWFLASQPSFTLKFSQLLGELVLVWLVYSGIELGIPTVINKKPVSVKIGLIHWNKELYTPWAGK